MTEERSVRVWLGTPQWERPVKGRQRASWTPTAVVIDEIAGAYKPIDDVMERQNDLVEPVHRLRQVLNIKA